MRAQEINRVSSRVLIVLSLTALLPVLSGYLPGHPPQSGLSHTLLKISDGSDDFLRDVLRGLSESELLIAGS